MIAAKGDTFGMADAGSLMLGAAQGAPIKTVMSLLNTSGFGIISLAETGIETVKDLEGKTLAVSPGDALTQLFPAVVAANELDGDSIELVFMDPPAKPVAVMEKRTDALLGGIDDQYFLIEAQGHQPAALRFADLGVNTVGITVLAHEDTLAENPDLVKRFVKASVRSWQAALDDPEAAVDAALKVKPDLNRDSTLKQLETDLGLLFSPNTEGKGIGYAAEADWQHTKELLAEYRDLETDRAAARSTPTTSCPSSRPRWQGRQSAPPAAGGARARAGPAEHRGRRHRQDLPPRRHGDPCARATSASRSGARSSWRSSALGLRQEHAAPPDRGPAGARPRPGSRSTAARSRGRSPSSASCSRSRSCSTGARCSAT